MNESATYKSIYKS